MKILKIPPEDSPQGRWTMKVLIPDACCPRCDSRSTSYLDSREQTGALVWDIYHCSQCNDDFDYIVDIEREG